MSFYRNKQPTKLILWSRPCIFRPVVPPSSLIWCVKQAKKNSFFQEFRLFQFSPKWGKSVSWILDMLFIEIFWCTDQKILAGAVGAHPLLAPGVKALKTRFLPIFGEKNSEIQKFFFLQISLFIGPIGGTNNIFLLGLPFWLYSNS